MARKRDYQNILTAICDRDAFARAIYGEDDLGAVIRAHTYLHEYLVSALKQALPHADVLDLESPRVSFWTLVTLARAIGIIDVDLYKALKAVGQLRNAFAHELERKLKADDVAKLQAAMKGRVGDLFHELTGASSKNVQRLRHSIWATKLAMEEVATGRRYRLWLKAMREAGTLPSAAPERDAAMRNIEKRLEGNTDLLPPPVDFRSETEANEFKRRHRNAPDMLHFAESLNRVARLLE